MQTPFGLASRIATTLSLLATLLPGIPLNVAAEQARAGAARPNILFCFADDWSWPHAGAYGDKVVKTPAFDRVAREGFLFTRAFSAAPSCTASRAAILTGQSPHRLEEGGTLHGYLPKKFPVYPDLLEQAGYAVGFTGKGWGPGNFKAGGRERNPAGPPSKSFDEFLKTVPAGKPFCFWFGSLDPHRPYEKGSGLAAGRSLVPRRTFMTAAPASHLPSAGPNDSRAAGPLTHLSASPTWHRHFSMPPG